MHLFPDKKPALIVLASFSVFAACLFWLDRPISTAVQDREFLPGDVEKAIQLSEFMAHGFGIAVILISVFVVVPQVRRMIPRVASCVILAGLAANLLKCCVGRYRPAHFLELADERISSPSVTEKIDSTWLGPFPIIQFPDQFENAIQSFPSAHTASVFGLAFGLTWLCQGRGRWLFLGLAGLASFQRIVSQSHWPSDVVAGFLVALGVTWLVTQNRTADHVFAKLENSTNS